MIGQLRRLLGWRIARYAGASTVATLADVGLFLVLIEGGVRPVIAAALGYGTGILVHWAISSRRVFADRLALAGYPRVRQQAGFVLSALVGLGLTVGIVAWGTARGFDPRIAKLAAMTASFLSVYAIRTWLVFRPR